MNQVVIVGGGLAGLSACEGLRQGGFGGGIVVVGDEEHDPYDRPPLSKQFLSGKWEEDRLLLRKPEKLAGLSVEWRKGRRATGLDLGRRVLALEDGEELSFDGLVLATGSRARQLPGFEHLAAAHLLRSLEDAIALRAALEPGVRLLVVGGGFIGMEVAATARMLGCEVDVVEPLEGPLYRVLGSLPAGACAALHRHHGVRLHLGVAVESVSEKGPERAVLAGLSDGTELEADLVVVGVGAVPNVDWLEGSGLEAGPNGVACDQFLSVAPGIVAAGDIARVPLGPARAPVRLEHRTNAAEQGAHAARTLLGDQVVFETVPYVWSDQYDLKIQLLGLPEPEDEIAIVEGEIETGRFLALYGRDGQLTGAVGFGMPRALMGVRALLASPTSFEEALGRFA